MPCHQVFRDDPSQLLLYKIASCLADGGPGGGVTSFNGLTGAVTFTGADVITLLGFTPLSQSSGDARYVLKAGDTMTGALVHPLGTAAAPSDSFTGDLDTGVFSPGADSVGVSTGGTLRFTVASTALTSTVPILVPLGSAAAPSRSFTGDLDTGVFSPGADSVGVSTGGTLRFTIATAGVTSTVPFLAPDGTAAAPSFSFASDPDTGIYRIGANSFGSSAGGSVILATSTTGINLTTALAYQYDSVNVIRAQTALNNYFFGPSGNLTMTGTDNTSIGFSAFTSNTTGSYNAAYGSQALLSNLSGNTNLAIGVNALFSNTTGGGNMALGFGALLSNIGGSSNSAIGTGSLSVNTSGNNNVAVGDSSLVANVTGGNNTGVGINALLNLTTGSQNTVIGYNTGLGVTTGSNNTVLGANVVGLAAGLSNNIIIADGAGVIRLQIDSSGNTTLAGTVATAAGTAALPAHTFSADLNTGIYNIGADSLGLSTGGTLRTTTNTTDLILATAFRLAFASGANTRAGNAVLIGGTVTVANTSVTANTLVIVTRKTSGGTIGFAVTYTVIAATSFTLTSDSALDTSTYSYILVENP